MKNKMAQLHQTLILVISLIFMSGMYYTVPAGQWHRSSAETKDTNVASSPAPVVDDTPINPDSSARIKSGDASRNSGPVKRHWIKSKINSR